MTAAGETTPAAPLPAADVLLRHALKVAIYKARQEEAAGNLAAVREAAQRVFGPVRRHGTPQQEVRLADGTRIGLISIHNGPETTTVDEDLLFMVAAGNEPGDLEEHVRPGALSDPRVLALIKAHLPDYVGCRIKAPAAALYAKEIEDNAGKVLDRAGVLGPAGERVQVATISRGEATGEFTYKPVAKGHQLVMEALDAGLLTDDGQYTVPAAEVPAEPEPVTVADDGGSAADDATRMQRALARGGYHRPALHPPTGEQSDILAVVATGDNVAVRAFAGTGKTTAIQHIGVQEDHRRGTYLAFGHDIVKEARDQDKFGPMMRVTTAHGLAMGAVGKRYKAKMGGPGGREFVPMQQAARILRISSPARIGDKNLAPRQLARLALQTVEQFCQSADDEITAGHAPARRGLDSPEQLGQLQHLILPWAQRAWEDLTASATAGELRFDHPHYLKLWQLTRPRIRADYIAVDEAQDMDPVMLDVLLRQDAQMLPVGDDYQAIHEWRGAVNALDQFDVKHDLALTQSFRFGPAIAAEANKWLTLLGSPRQVCGWDRRSSMLRQLVSANAILCRSNIGAMAEVIRSVTAGEKTALAGGDKAASDLRRLAEAAAELRMGRGTSHPELVAFQTWRQVQEFAEEDADGSFKTLVRIVDEHGPEKIIEIIGALADEADAAVTISTVHKAKGREWDSVRISDDFREPAGDTIDPEEGRLAYVAVTRARLALDRSGLAWVDEYLPERATAGAA